MLKVKVCGITRTQDARLAVDLGAEYLGLNFYPPSPRCLDMETARRIADAVRGQAVLVGVFVNHPEAAEIASTLELDLLQFCGEEGPADLAPFGDRAIKVFRPQGSFDSDELSSYPDCWGFLFDRPHKTLYGGTGETWPHERIAGLKTPKPVFLAGGLGPRNVRPVRRLAGIFGVDVCSQVESEPGIKDPALLRQLFVEARGGETSDAP